MLNSFNVFQIYTMSLARHIVNITMSELEFKHSVLGDVDNVYAFYFLM